MQGETMWSFISCLAKPSPLLSWPGLVVLFPTCACAPTPDHSVTVWCFCFCLIGCLSVCILVLKAKPSPLSSSSEGQDWLLVVSLPMRACAPNHPRPCAATIRCKVRCLSNMLSIVRRFKCKAVENLNWFKMARGERGVQSISTGCTYTARG